MNPLGYALEMLASARRTLSGSAARRNMLVIAAAGLMNSTFTIAVESVILPLWLTRELGWSPAEWARLRSLRMIGVVAGVPVFGVVAGLIGEDRMGTISMTASAVFLLVVACFPGWGLWVTMPVLGALVSTGYVNISTLVQGISERRQGLANAIYRTMGATASVIAPVLATTLAAVFSGYRPVLFCFSGLILAAGIVLAFYRGPRSERTGAGLRADLRALLGLYRSALAEKPLMRVIHWTQIWSNLVIGVSVFAAIRFTSELGQPDRVFGLLQSAGGVLTIGAMLPMALVIDRVRPPILCGSVAVVAGAACALMGAGSSLPVSAAAYAVFLPFCFAFIAPSFLWMSRAAGPVPQSAVFGIHKILSAVYIAAATGLAGLLEPLVGIGKILLFGGLLGVVAGIRLFRLPAPDNR